ncbi:Transcriptional regulatory protein zraR [Acidisarcina polymorpha]|uniref:Transcriptional regulatory protein zraR n=1 Tax=Acidisarcina polymorpha TaxID=2211140 RepID=A0A2Z5G4B3_9BACT|nr:ATP-binding protein [Acidisarcina polymorpha]AXC13567.1 Transcriptional regulatory protein zraR [Acidisarcina polymorpha]
MSLETQIRQKVAVVCCCEDAITARVTRILNDWRILRIGSDKALKTLLTTETLDLILTGEETSSQEAVELLRSVLDVQPETKVILRPLEGSPEDVIAAMRAGAFSYFSKTYFEAAFDEMLRHAASDAPWRDGIRVDSATPAWLRLIARCELMTADRVIQFMSEISHLEAKDRESMGFALKEILMNAMEYGGKFNWDRLVEVSYVCGKRMALYRVRDPGEGFSLSELSHAAISNPPEEPVRHLDVRDALGIRPGGFGVMLSKKLVDDLIYNEQGNDVLLIKYFDEHPTPSSKPE